MDTGVRRDCLPAAMDDRVGWRKRVMAKGVSEDRLATFVHLLEVDTGVRRDCLPAAMDDRVGWRKRVMAKGVSEDRLATFVHLLEVDTGVRRDCLPAAMDDRVGWRKRVMAKGVSEDRLAQLLICWKWTPGSAETACRQRWMTGLAGERESWQKECRRTGWHSCPSAGSGHRGPQRLLAGSDG